MEYQSTPRGERQHIGLFGRMNSGKSSIINAITGQNTAIVSEIRGTTTDPVLKSMEILPMGPVVLMDTPGLDDESELGPFRIEKTQEIMGKSDLALIVIDTSEGLTPLEERLTLQFREKRIPYILVFNKTDLTEGTSERKTHEGGENVISVSARTGKNIHELKERMGKILSKEKKEKRILEGLISRKDIVLLVVPVDSAAPKGRIILPQQQVLREILDTGAQAVVVQVEELSDALDGLKRKPKLVITDSQAFGEVKKLVPEDIELTSFSILMARYKGNLKEAVKAAHLLGELEENSTILISEGCTHHRQCDDIGTVKLPEWIRMYTGKDFNFIHSSGSDFKIHERRYDLVVHCGGCMLSEKDMQNRIGKTIEHQMPITNYGVLIAHMNGILARSISVFKEKL